VDKPDKRAHRNSISPNFVHSLDAAHLVRTVVAAANEGIDQMCVIHDSFACTPGNAGRLNRIVREEFVRMYEEHDVLAEFKASILSQFPGIVLPDPPEKGTLDLSGVLNSQYAFS
jgi:DNA-directed RNA polymerase